MSEVPNKKISRLIKMLCAVMIYFICAMLFWRIPIYLQLNALKLPEGVQTVYPPMAAVTDKGYGTIRAEKIVKLQNTLEDTTYFAEKNKSRLLSWHIDTEPYENNYGREIYSSRSDGNFTSLPDTEKAKYLRIIYERELFEFTPIDYITLIAVFIALGIVTELIFALKSKDIHILTFKNFMRLLTYLHIFIAFISFFLSLACYQALPMLSSFFSELWVGYGDFLERIRNYHPAAITAVFFLCCFAYDWAGKNTASFKFGIGTILFNTALIIYGTAFFTMMMSV